MDQKTEILKRVNDSIPTYSVANAIVSEAVKSHDFQWKLFRSIEDHVAGKKPIPREKLVQQGLGWSSNWTYNKARAQIQRNVIDLSKKILNALAVGSPEFKIGTPEDRRDEKKQFLFDENRRGAVSSMLGYCFARALEEDGDLFSWLNKIEYFTYTFGYSPLCWNEKTWVPDVVGVTNIAFPPGTNPRDIDQWVVFRSEKAEDLYNTYTRIKNKKSKQQEAKDNGEEVKPIKYSWNTDALEKVLVKLYSGRKQNKGTYESWGEILPVYQENPAGVIAMTEDLNIAEIYKVEANGDITVAYIPWGHKWCNGQRKPVGGKADDTAEILYKKVHKDKERKDLLRIIQDSGFTETGDIHSLRGTGKESVENSIRYNRLRNSINNKSELIGSPMFEQPSTQTGEKMKITHSQGFTLLQPGFLPIENQPSYDIQSSLAIMATENKEFADNNSHFDSNATGKLSSRPTNDEISLARSEQERTQGSKDAVKIRDYSGMFYHIMKMMITSDPAKGSVGRRGRDRFYKLCKQHIHFCETDEDVKSLLKLVDGYSIDLVNMEISSLQMAMQLAETPYGRNRIKRMMLISQGFGIREVNTMVPVITDKFRSFDDTRVALIENDMFLTTDEVVFSETDDHIIHYEQHVSKMDKTFTAIREGNTDIVAAYDFLVRLYAHIFLHIDVIIKDPVLQGTGKDWIEKMRERKKVIDQVSYASSKEVARRQQEAEQNNPGISPKDAHDMRLKGAQAQAQEQRNQFKTKQRGDLKMEDLKMKQALAKQELNQKHEQEMTKIKLEAQRESLKDEIK